MNLIKTINQVIKKENISTNKEIKEAQELNKRANIVSIGQIQMRTIKASGNTETSVNRPEAAQRPKNLIKDLGIKYIDGLSANFVYPIINNNNSEWVGETEEISANDTEFDSISLQPKRLASYVEYSKDVILNPSVEVGESIQEDLINSVYDKVQTTMFNDIYDSASTITVSGYSDIVNLEYIAATKNISNGVYLVSPLAAKSLKLMKNGDSPIISNGMINGYRVIESPSLSGESIIFGDFTKLLLGQWGALDITLDSVTKAPKGIVRLTINSYWNWGIIDDNAFVFGTTDTEAPF